MSDPSQKSKPAILADTPNTISSQASAAGPTRCDSPDGLMTALFGPDPVPASRSRRRAKDSAPKTNGISGPSSFDSSPSAVLQSSLASRLRARLDGRGSPLFALTWKTWDMPSGPPICALRASGRRTSDSDSTSWPTPSASGFEARDPQRLLQRRAECKARTKNGNGFGLTLGQQVRLLLPWMTPTAVTDSGGAALCKWGGTRSRAKLKEAVGNTVLNGPLAPEFALWLMGYPTVWARCAEQVTPSSRSSRRSSSKPTRRRDNG